MPSPTVVTPQMERVRQLADEAMTTPEGIRIYFRVEKYGSLKAANTAARGIQTSFSNLRARTRRTAMRLAGESTTARDVMAKGPYDNVACVKGVLPNDEGYTISFVPGYALDMDLDVEDIATGKPFAQEDPALNRFVMLFGKFFKEDSEARAQHRPRMNPFTSDELAFLWAHDADECERMGIPTLAEDAAQSAMDYESVDLATLGEDELEIVNPSENV